MNNSQSGNVLFYILIAVVLLAALTYAINQSQRGNVGQITDEKARVIASEIIEYASTISTATAQLRLRGIKETNLCYDDAGWGNANYTHAACSDDTNKIFHLKGGGVTWTKAPTEAMTGTPDYLWHIYSDNEIENAGSTCADEDCADLLLVVDELREDVCKKINELLGVTLPNTAPPSDTNIGDRFFNGAFDYTETIGGAALQGKQAACFLNATDNEYTFYKVLIAR